MNKFSEIFSLYLLRLIFVQIIYNHEFRSKSNGRTQSCDAC